ncbi:MAG: hypothetical protein RMJ87_08515 [Cytophagales bacterium]|nr:hypothetical protein [Cytophagales bacterium]
MSFLTQLLPLKHRIEVYLSKACFDSLVVAPELEYMQSVVNGEAVAMWSQAWQNKQFRYVRMSYLTSASRIEMLNLTMYPQVCYDAPLFATDIVVVNQRLRVAVIDAMPIFPSETAYWERWILPFEPLHRQSLLLAPVYDRKLDWSFHYLGPCACLATQLPAERFPALFDLWSGYFELYWELATDAISVCNNRMEQVQEWHRAYDKEHAAVESKRNPLLHYFGRALGLRYIHEFLFASTIG